MRRPAKAIARAALAALLAAVAAKATASDFDEPWRRADRALVIDAYEYNPIDWDMLVTDKRIVGFINKGSDGLPPPYRCSGDETEFRLCKALWKRYSVAKELYRTRRALARSKGLLWGAYHLGRPGNPIDQANHFIDFADPQPDELIAIDIEDNDPEKWMSLGDAEIFARHIKTRLGRYPVLYTNGNTARYIASNRHRFPLLSRLPLWYARYRPEIGRFFPKGNWERYALWQFVSQINCGKRRCPYRPPGTPHDIDVNVAAMDARALRRQWPFGGLVPQLPMPLPAGGFSVASADAGGAPEIVARLPLPAPRRHGLEGAVRIVHADIAMAPIGDRLHVAYRAMGTNVRAPGIPLGTFNVAAEQAASSIDSALARLAAAYRATGPIWPRGRRTVARDGLAMLEQMASAQHRVTDAAAPLLAYGPPQPARNRSFAAMLAAWVEPPLPVIGPTDDGVDTVETGALAGEPPPAPDLPPHPPF